MKSFNENKDPISDCESESKNRPYKPGHYYNGNMTINSGSGIKEQGSQGLKLDQGAIRVGRETPVIMLGECKDNVMHVIPEGKQGSAAHLKLKPANS